MRASKNRVSSYFAREKGRAVRCCRDMGLRILLSTHRVCLSYCDKVTKMQVLEFVAVQVPLIIACAIFALAAILKVGKEKGASLIAAGAIGVFLMGIAAPVFYTFILPRILANMNSQSLPHVMSICSGLINLLWAVALALVAAGTFLRSPAREKS